MTQRDPFLDEHGEIRELTEEDFTQMRPLSEVNPELLSKLKAMSKRGPQKSPTKERITIRLSPEVTEYFRASGKGWQTRLDEALKAFVTEQQK